MSDRENNRIQIFDTGGKLLKTWTHLGCTQGMYISPKDEMWIITHRNNSENITYDTLAGQVMKIDVESGKILGSMESPGHMLTATPNGRRLCREPHGQRVQVAAGSVVAGESARGDRTRSASAEIARARDQGRWLRPRADLRRREAGSL